MNRNRDFFADPLQADSRTAPDYGRTKLARDVVRFGDIVAGGLLAIGAALILLAEFVK